MWGTAVKPESLRAWSPKALVTASTPPTRFITIKPFEFLILIYSSTLSHLSSMDIRSAWPPFDSTALVSPIFATYNTLCIPSFLTMHTQAVDPQPSESTSLNSLSIYTNEVSLSWKKVTFAKSSVIGLHKSICPFCSSLRISAGNLSAQYSDTCLPPWPSNTA